jgi:hypothetical protein
MDERLVRNSRPIRNQGRASSPQSTHRSRDGSKHKSLSELLSIDIALENWTAEERSEFEEKFSKKYKRSFFDFSLESKKGWQFYCPLCGCTRRASQSPTPDRWIHWARVAVTSALLTVFLWPWLKWNGLLTFLPLWIFFEAAFRIRLRAELACDQCGFDPILYLSDVNRARREVDDFWKRKLGAETGSKTEEVLNRTADGMTERNNEGRDAESREEVAPI